MKKTIIMLLLICVYAFCYAEKEQDNAIKKQIAKDYKGYVIAPTGCEDKFTPSLISADFNGDKITDYAVILEKLKGPHVEYLWVVYLGKKEGFKPAIVLDKYDIDLNDEDSANKFFIEGSKYTIWLEPPGLFKVIRDDIENRKPMRIYLPSIGVGQCESAAGFWYWNKKQGKFIQEWTSD